MMNVFGKMIQNLQDDDFVRQVSKNLPSTNDISPEFKKQYEKYQKNPLRKKKADEAIFVNC